MNDQSYLHIVLIYLAVINVATFFMSEPFLFVCDFSLQSYNFSCK